MLSLALETHPQLLVKNLEGNREGPSFTVDTLQELSASSQDRYHFILGEDCMEEFLRWKKPEEIVRLAPLIVVGRGSKVPDLTRFEKHESIAAAFRSGWTPTRLMDISSTEIRERLSNRLFCRHLVPEKVMDYIYENHLY
jgi:nicotinate-nucleotide adenylyltransferase